MNETANSRQQPDDHENSRRQAGDKIHNVTVKTMTQDLAERQSELLRLLVEQYIATAAPVSSGGLVERHELEVSSATVRNTFAELESEGYVERTHSSAGATPTGRAYRYYVEVLLRSSEVPTSRQETIRHQFHQVESEDVFLWARLAAATLARLSEALAIVTPLPGHTEHGMDEPVVYGISQVVNQPELIDRIDMVRELLDAVESGRLAPALHTDDLPATGLRVVIGNEHDEPFLHPYAAVMSTYGPTELSDQRGAVVALGPTRMDYAAAIPAVRYLGELLSNMAETLDAVYQNREYV